MAKTKPRAESVEAMTTLGTPVHAAASSIADDAEVVQNCGGPCVVDPAALIAADGAAVEAQGRPVLVVDAVIAGVVEDTDIGEQQ